MCDVVVTPMLIVAAASAVIGGGISAYSANQSASAQADIATENARVERMKANYADALGASEAGRARMEGSQAISQQRVELGAGGVDVSSGTSLNVFGTTRALSELDAKQARVNGALEAWGHRTQANVDQVQARVARRNSVLGPLATGFNTLGTVASMGYSGQKGRG